MPNKPIVFLVFIAGASIAPAQPVLPGFDLTKASAVFSGDMGFDDGPGKLDILSFDVRSALSRPVTVTENFFIVPMAGYKFTTLDFSDTATAFPIEDEDLHSFSLSSFFVHSAKQSPWIFGAFARAELATDFQDLDGDDITFDIAAGVAYKFNDSLTIGLGGVVLNLNNEEEFIFGPAIDWKPNDCFRAGLYGPNGVVSWTPDENWEISLRGAPGGDEWNIRDATGNSTTVDLDSYRVGLYADRRLTGDLWLRLGGGVTLGNEIEYRTPDGDRLSQDDMDEGWFGELTLRLKTW